MTHVLSLPPTHTTHLPPCQAGRFDAAAEVLDALWDAHPPGTDEWWNARVEGGEAGAGRGLSLNLGVPVCYAALRMITESVRHATAGGEPISWLVPGVCGRPRLTLRVSGHVWIGRRRAIMSRTIIPPPGPTSPPPCTGQSPESGLSFNLKVLMVQRSEVQAPPTLEALRDRNNRSVRRASQELPLDSKGGADDHLVLWVLALT
jgi:hypothetical protein